MARKRAGRTAPSRWTCSSTLGVARMYASARAVGSSSVVSASPAAIGISLRGPRAQELDQETDADAGASLRPITLRLVEVRSAGDVEVRPWRGADEMFEERRGRDGAGILPARVPD